jgi:hypothetical protein
MKAFALASAALVAVAAAAMGAGADSPPQAQAHFAVSTTNAAAQAAFDRGLAMLYAFSVAQARVEFAQAATLDPRLGMASWGQAVADTIDINLPQTADGDRRGAAAVATARAHEAGATPQERALIDAIARRYGRGSTSDRFGAYAGAMTRAATAYPDDANVQTLAAYARWNAAGEVFERGDGSPNAAASEMQRELDVALTLEPANIGAHHLRIHLCEVLGHADAALPDAQFFDGLAYAPGMSHLPHMAGHVYARIGAYDAMIAANQRAVANDDAYFALGDGPGQTYMRRYHDHDLDFIVYGLTTQGRFAEARAVAAGADATMRLRVALRAHDAAAALALATAAPWNVVALARAGRTAEAAAAFAKAGTHTGFDDDDQAQLAIAGAVLARAQGDLDAAADGYRVALKLIGDYPGDPKTAWYVPPGEGLGAVLLQAKHYGPAEAAFRSELARFPNDPRLAFGLAEAQHAQGHDDAAARAIVAREWKGDRALTVEDLG